MKGILLDENLPSKTIFTPSLPVHHVTEISTNPTDTEVWEYAKNHHWVIVTKDANFFHRIAFTQAPPWVVHLKIGNMRRREFHRFLASVWPKIETLLSSHKLVTVFQNRLEAVS